VSWNGGSYRVTTRVNPAAGQAAAVGSAAALADIRAAVAARDYPRAMQLADAALAQGVADPLVYSLASLRLESLGRLHEAADLLTRATTRFPGQPPLLNALALVLHRLGRASEALAVFDTVVAASPRFAGAHAGRGLALEALGRLPAAEAAFSAAEQLEPQNLVALTGLANLATRRAEHGRARGLAERVLALHPGHPEAEMALAAADAADGRGAAAAARLAVVAGSADTPPELRAQALGLLGDIHDGLGEPERAFASYAACNAALSELHKTAFGHALPFAREMLQQLRALPLEAWRPGPSAGQPGPCRTHVFLLGFPRSGTTLLEQALGRHDDVATLEERDTLAAATQAYMATPDGVTALAAAPDSSLEALREAYWARVAQEGAEVAGKVFIDKHPFNTFRLPLIARLFPQSRILLARRDPRDVVWSCYRRRFAMSSAAYELLSLESAADYFATAMAIARHLEPCLGDRTFVVRHESLLADFDGVLAAVCADLGLPWQDALRDVAAGARGGAAATPSARQLAGGLRSDLAGAWRAYAEPMAAVMPTLQPWIDAFGYSSPWP
jgi:tetratricopeptide (TPR) repeat protein